MRRLLALSTALILFTATARAEVGDPTLETDHPLYAGEGAFQTVEQCVARATAGKETPQDKALALYLSMLTHQFHLSSPQEWNVAGLVPDTAKDGAYDMIVYDAQRARFSYGYGLCGTVHAWNEPYWKALGMNARRRGFPGHTNSEIEYGGSWHTYDTDMAGLVFRKDGVVAGYDDVVKDPTCIEVDKSPLPRYPFAWPGDFQGMKKGWKQVAKGGKWIAMYHSGYAAQPGIVHLRSGESFTRYFDRDHFGGADKRRFWHHMKGGPFRDWTYVNTGGTDHKGEKSNSRGNASYCNGEFIYRPNLATPAYKEGVVQQTVNVVSAEFSPVLRSKDGGPAAVTFQHFSPYVICGQPADGANPMTAAATGGLVVSGQAVGPVALELSVDQGQTWKPVGEVEGKFDKDLTDDAKGRYGWQLRFNWKGGDGMDSLTFTTVTQVAQPMYPRLKPEGSSVVYRAGSKAAVVTTPNFGTAEAVAGRYEEKTMRSANMVYTPRDAKQRFGYSIQGPKPGHVVFRVEAPTELTQVSAAARFNVRVPPPDNADYHLELSTDAGKTWKPLGRADVPKDNEYSSAWMYGSADVTAAKTKTALVRVHLYANGYPAGLMAAELYGVHRVAAPQPMKLTYGWKEDGKLKTHVEDVAAGAREHKFKVPTGKTIVDDFVRMEVP